MKTKCINKTKAQSVCDSPLLNLPFSVSRSSYSVAVVLAHGVAGLLQPFESIGHSLCAGGGGS